MHITVLYIWNIIICALIRVIIKTLQVVTWSCLNFLQVVLVCPPQVVQANLVILWSQYHPKNTLHYENVQKDKQYEGDKWLNV